MAIIRTSSHGASHADHGREVRRRCPTLSSCVTRPVWQGPTCSERAWTFVQVADCVVAWGAIDDAPSRESCSMVGIVVRPGTSTRFRPIGVVGRYNGSGTYRAAPGFRQSAHPAFSMHEMDAPPARPSANADAAGRKLDCWAASKKAVRVSSRKLVATKSDQPAAAIKGGQCGNAAAVGLRPAGSACPCVKSSQQRIERACMPKLVLS